MDEIPDSCNIRLARKGVYQRLGYNRRPPSTAIASLIDEAIMEANDLIQPSFSHQLMDIKQVQRPNITLVNSTEITLSSEVLSWVLKPCKQAVIFVASIGQNLEKRVAQLMDEGHMVKAAMLDATGSEAAEKTVEYLQAQVRKLAKACNAEVTLRYSPGYCDWDIAQQRLLFKAVEPEAAGVMLTQECLMLPRKSISGIIGIGWGDKRRIRLSPCRSCTKQDCPHRR